MTWSSPPTLGCLWRRSYPPSALFCISFLADRCFSCRYNSLSVQQGPGGGRCAVRSRHGQKGGIRCGDGRGFPRRGFLLQRGNHNSGVSLRDTEPLGQCGEGAGGGIAKGAQRREEGGEEDVDPLIGLALAHTEQAPVHHLKAVCLQVGEQEEQPIVRGRQGTVLIDSK